MSKRIKVGILKESKRIPDKRVALPPKQAKKIKTIFPNIEIYVESSTYRCFSDKEYIAEGISVKKDITDCDIFLGLKEMDIPSLTPENTYVFFSHTAKKQLHNRPLLQAILKKNICLVDYEYLTDINHVRLAAFGRWAGIVGAYNGVRARGLRTGFFELKPAHECKDMEEMFKLLEKVKLKPMKILVTGEGRVAHGAAEILDAMKIKKISAEQLLHEKFDAPVYAQIGPNYYVKNKNGSAFDLNHFFNYPQEYVSTFQPFTKVTDILITGHFWDQRSPVFITNEEMQTPDFNISVIADISCDLNGPIPSTLRASTIKEPFYGYNPTTGKETKPFDKKSITVMAVDNLPSELPRDASVDFSNILIGKVLPSLFGEDKLGIIERATITKNGKLTVPFSYLQNFVDEKE